MATLSISKLWDDACELELADSNNVAMHSRGEAGTLVATTFGWHIRMGFTIAFLVDANGKQRVATTMPKADAVGGVPVVPLSDGWFKVWTGLRIEPPKGWGIAVSGLAGAHVKDEVMVGPCEPWLHFRWSKGLFVLHKGQRAARICVLPLSVFREKWELDVR